MTGKWGHILILYNQARSSRVGNRVKQVWPSPQIHELKNTGWATPEGARGVGRAFENIPQK